MFAIDQENRIRYLASHQRAWSDTETVFRSHTELHDLAEYRKWSKQTVTDIWNWLVKDFALAGIEPPLKPQKCFKNRAYGLAKLWDAIQRLVPNGNAASEAPDSWTAPIEYPESYRSDPEEEKKPVKTKTRQMKAAKPKGEKRVKGGSKKDQALAMLLRKSGATAEEIEERLGWSKVSVGMLIQWVRLVTSAGIKSIETEKNSKGERVYKAAA